MPAEQSNKGMKRPVVLKLEGDEPERLQSMLDVHVRPVYYETAKGDTAPEWGQEQLELVDDLSDRLRAALDSPPVEERAKNRYRVVGENKAGKRWERPVTTDLQLAEQIRGELASAGHNRWVKIEVSTATTFTSPWKDVEEQ
jgi:hypothetical protein